MRLIDYRTRNSLYPNIGVDQVLAFWLSFHNSSPVDNKYWMFELRNDTSSVINLSVSHDKAHTSHDDTEAKKSYRLVRQMAISSTLYTASREEYTQLVNTYENKTVRPESIVVIPKKYWRNDKPIFFHTPMGLVFGTTTLESTYDDTSYIVGIHVAVDLREENTKEVTYISKQDVLNFIQQHIIPEVELWHMDDVLNHDYRNKQYGGTKSVATQPSLF